MTFFNCTYQPFSNFYMNMNLNRNAFVNPYANKQAIFSYPQNAIKSANCFRTTMIRSMKFKESQENNKTKGKKTSRQKFTQEEDDKLKELVEKMGSRKWESIAKEMPGRTGRQCRDRYQNYLTPGFFNGQWSSEEDYMLRLKYMELGPQWSKISLFFKSRSPNSLKNRWNYFVSKHFNDITYTNIQPKIDRTSEYNDDDVIVEDKNDIIYENITSFTSSLNFIDLDPINDKNDFSLAGFTFNDI